MDITGRIFNGGNIDVRAVCVDFCTEEERYLDPDSHFIHIPRDLYLNFLKRKSDSGYDTIPLYVGIRNSKNPNGKKFFFGRVEPSLTTENSHHTMALLPKWVFEKLELDMMDATIDILYVPIPQSVALIKIKGSNALYVQTDIKTNLENKLAGYNCLNIGEEFKVGETTFKVIELRNKNNKIIEFGSIYNIDECNLDFEMCDEEIEKEKARIEALKQLEIERSKPRELQKATTQNDKHIEKSSSNKFGKLRSQYAAFGARVHSLKDDNEEEKKEETKEVEHFQGTSNRIGGTKIPLTRQQILEARMKAFESQKN